MNDIVEFLTARLDEDEAAAKDVPTDLVGRDWTTAESGGYTGGRIFLIGNDTPWQFTGVANSHDEATATHIARHDPARVLREVEAKRAIIEDYRVVTANAAIERANGDEVKAAAGDLIVKTLRMVLLRLAQPYEQHPDYNPAWRVE